MKRQHICFWQQQKQLQQKRGIATSGDPFSSTIEAVQNTKLVQLFVLFSLEESSLVCCNFFCFEKLCFFFWSGVDSTTFAQQTTTLQQNNIEVVTVDTLAILLTFWEKVFWQLFCCVVFVEEEIDLYCHFNCPTDSFPWRQTKRTLLLVLAFGIRRDVFSATCTSTRCCLLLDGRNKCQLLWNVILRQLFTQAFKMNECFCSRVSRKFGPSNHNFQGHSFPLPHATKKEKRKKKDGVSLQKPKAKKRYDDWVFVLFSIVTQHPTSLGCLSVPHHLFVLTEKTWSNTTVCLFCFFILFCANLIEKPNKLANSTKKKLFFATIAPIFEIFFIQTKRRDQVREGILCVLFSSHCLWQFQRWCDCFAVFTTTIQQRMAQTQKKFFIKLLLWLCKRKSTLLQITNCSTKKKTHKPMSKQVEL